MSVCNVGVLWPNGWIKMPLGTEVGIGPGDTVRWGPSFPFVSDIAIFVLKRDVKLQLTNPASPTERGIQQPHTFRPTSCGQTVAYLSNCWALVKLFKGGQVQVGSSRYAAGSARGNEIARASITDITLAIHHMSLSHGPPNHNHWRRCRGDPDHHKTIWLGGSSRARKSTKIPLK